MDCIHGQAQRKAFTLVELLVVIAIIALLLSILMPSLQRARSQTKQLVCLNNSRQMGQIFLVYASDNSMKYPATRGHSGVGNTWYSNVTHWLDSSKSINNKVYLMTEANAKIQNRPWMKLLCPESKLDKIPTYQGLPRTYGIHIAAEKPDYPNTGFGNGYGIVNWATGDSRKTFDVARASSMIVLSDSTNIEYIYSSMYLTLESRNEEQIYLPKRHPQGYGATFADGHSSIVEQKELKNVYSPIWRAK